MHKGLAQLLVLWLLLNRADSQLHYSLCSELILHLMLFGILKFFVCETMDQVFDYDILKIEQLVNCLYKTPLRLFCTQYPKELWLVEPVSNLCCALDSIISLYARDYP